MANPITDYMGIWTSAQVPKTNGGRGRASNVNGQGIYGIKKLRELILELAVRGKLVPQDPNDEPAGVLLKRIAEEKKRLVKEGKIKRKKALAEVGEKEGIAETPPGWSYTMLGNLINLVSGQHLKPQEYAENKEKNMIPYLTGPAEFGDKFPCPTRYTYEKRALALKGNILLTCKGSGVGKVNIAQSDIAISRQLMAIQPFFVEKEYLLLLVQSLNSILREKIVGIAIPGISREDVTEAIVMLPPLAEQQRIVAKANELMALCDQLEQQQIDSNDIHQTLVETLLTALTSATDPKEFADTWQRIADHFDILFSTEQSIDQLKQTILQLAVMGKLVPQDPNDEPAGVLLQKIAEEKKRLVKEGKIKKQKALPEVGEDEKPFELPNGWVWARFNKIVNPIYPLSYGVLVPGPNVDRGIPFVRIGDLDLVNPPIHPEKSIDSAIDHKYERTRLHGGEILMGIVGSIGKLGIAPDSWKGANIARAICRIAPSPYVSKQYMICLLKSDFMQNMFTDDTRTLAQPTLNIGLIKNAITPLPPLAEQRRIVVKVNELMVICDNLKARINENQTAKVQLADAIVEKAVA